MIGHPGGAGLPAPRVHTARLAGFAAIVLFALAAAGTLHAQGLRLFDDSTSPASLDVSWGYANSPSWLLLVNDSHFPVDTTHVFLGSNALRLAWLSASGGDWMLAAATPGWTPLDPGAQDSLLFMAWTPAAVSAADLPDVLLEDSNNVRTPRHALSEFCAGLPASAWTRVSVPLSVFRANPGAANLHSVNKLFFAQGPSNAPGAPHQVYVDEIRFVPAGITAPMVPVAGTRSFERHAEVRWDAAALGGTERVRVEALESGQWKRLGDARAEDGAFVDWVGASGIARTYRLTAFNWDFASATTGATVDAQTVPMTDDQWLDMAEEAAFRYFWNHAHPNAGLARERYGSVDECATGGTGMGIMATIAAVHRGWVPRADAAARVRGILQFYSTVPTRYHGAFAHWLNGSTGVTIAADTPADPAGDIVETSYLLQAALAARQYFDGPGAVETQLRTLATQLWASVDYAAFRPASPGDAVDWLWSPTTGFTNSFPVSGWDECMIVYLLATASPTHAIPPSCYTTGWSRYGAMLNGNAYYGHTLWLGTAYGGPMFFAHYSFLGFDPRFYRDGYANYFLQNRNQALVQVDYSAANPYGHAGYSASVWGLTASDDPVSGYAVHAPYSGDNGTLAPTAALASMPYVPAQSMAALQAMYRQYGAGLWGPFGFRDAFNPGQNWYDPSYIAIDEGPIAVMIENFRSHLLWNSFMANPEIQPALNSLGFFYDGSVGVPPGGEAEPALALAPPAPNPVRDGAAIEFTLPTACSARLAVFDTQGREVARLADGALDAGTHRGRWDARDAHGRRLAPGVYLVRLTGRGRTLTRRVVVIG